MGASTYKSYKPRQSDNPPSPVSPLESNGENWKYPPIANSHLKAQETRSDIHLQEIRGKQRLSRPFEQPYPVSTSGPRQTSGQPTMQANMKRADSHLRQQPAQVPKRKAAPPPLAIPAPTHQARRQREENPISDSQMSAERSNDRRDRDLERQDESTQHARAPQYEKATDNEGKRIFIALTITAILGIIATVVYIEVTKNKG